MTEQFIIKQLARWTDDQKFPFQIPNAFIYQWESDYWIMTKDGETREFEIKISKADFLKDKHKIKHQCCDKGANYFYYVVPRGMIQKNEIEKKYGLIWVNQTGGLEIVKRPARLNNNSFDQWKMLASKMYWRWRLIWKEKYIAGDLTHDQFQQGFNLQLEQSAE